MQHVAYLTTADLVGFPIYDDLTVEPLRALGYEIASVDWRADEDWSRYAAVLPRSPWDYHLHPGEFFEVLGRIETSSAKLFNDLEVMRWNSDKRYMAELATKGLRVVATEFGVSLDADRVESLRDHFGSTDLVLKPAVSASAEDTFLLRDGDDLSGAIASLNGREWLAQPFMPGIVEEGEYSLIYFDGEFSHALLKIAGAGDFRVQESWGGTIAPAKGEGLLRERADSVIRELPSDLLYARIDLVRSNGDFELMEAELVEPSLYFSMDSKAPGRFAAALAGRLKSGS